MLSSTTLLIRDLSLEQLDFGIVKRVGILGFEDPGISSLVCRLPMHMLCFFRFTSPLFPSFNLSVLLMTPEIWHIYYGT